MRLDHHDESSTAARKDTQTAWQDASVEAEKTPFFLLMYLVLSMVEFPTPFVSAWLRVRKTSKKGKIIQYPITAALPKHRNYPNLCFIHKIRVPTP